MNVLQYCKGDLSLISSLLHPASIFLPFYHFQLFSFPTKTPFLSSLPAKIKHSHYSPILCHPVSILFFCSLAIAVTDIVEL